MEFGFSTAAYVVAAVLFILSLGGLSGQESAKRAVWYGISAMALAIFATLIGPGSGNWLLALVMLLVGGGAGWVVAQRVQMTEEEALVLWPRIKRFTAQEGRPPNPNSPDDLERRLAEAHAYIRTKKAERMRAAQGGA